MSTLTITPATTFADLQTLRDAGKAVICRPFKSSTTPAINSLSFQLPVLNNRNENIQALRSDLEALLELLK